MIYSSVYSNLLEQYMVGKRKALSSSYFKKVEIALTSFDAYCEKTGLTVKTLTESTINDWLSGQSNKNSYCQSLYKTAIRQFAIYLLDNGIKAHVPPCRVTSAQQKETSGFNSCLAGFIEGLVESKRSRGFKYGPYNEQCILKRFDEFCIREGLAGDTLPRWIVEKWSERTVGEGAKSRSNRIVVIRQLALYMIALGGNAYVAEAAPVPHDPFPYVPDEGEMSALLAEIDAQKYKTPWTRLTVPVMVRLLLASGLRISEACLLKTGCIDFKEDGYCSIDIIDAKGHRDRRIFLAGDILILLKAYDRKISNMLPEREWFFPGDYRPLSEHVSPGTVRERFRLARDIVYDVYTKRMPTIHSLRHAYIIWTIRGWREEKLNVNEMLPYLSKHLGHSSIQETYTYYDHYSQDYDHISKDKQHYEAIVPEVHYDN